MLGQQISSADLVWDPSGVRDELADSALLHVISFPQQTRLVFAHKRDAGVQESEHKCMRPFQVMTNY